MYQENPIKFGLKAIRINCILGKLAKFKVNRNLQFFLNAMIY